MVGHVVFGIIGRAVGLGVGIDTEHGIVTRLAGPHPVVRFATVLTHRLGNGEHQAHIVEVAVGGAVVLVALIERLDFHAQRRVFLADILLPCILDAVDNGSLFVTLDAFQGWRNLVCYVLLFYHEADEQVLVGQLFFKALGIESVQHIIVLNGRVLANGIKTTVMVGKYKSIRRYHNTRTEATKVDNRILDSIIALIQLIF